MSAREVDDANRAFAPHPARNCSAMVRSRWHYAECYWCQQAQTAAEEMDRLQAALRIGQETIQKLMTEREGLEQSLALADKAMDETISTLVDTQAENERLRAQVADVRHRAHQHRTSGCSVEGRCHLCTEVLEATGGP